MRQIIMLFMVFGSISAYGDICNIAGFISDSGPAAEGTEVIITNLEYDVAYRTVTGTGWPYSNYYLQTITCDVGKHEIEIRATKDGRTAFATLVPDSRLVQVNLSLPPAPAISESPASKEDKGRGGGGGGGSGGSIPVVDTRLDKTYDLQEDGSLSVFTTDRWFNLDRYVLNVSDITSDTVTLELPMQSLTLYLGKNTTADINLDGIQDYAIFLEAVEGTIAHVRFFKIWNPVLVEEGIEKEMPRPAITEEETRSSSDVVYLVGICVILMALAILMALKQRGAKR
jgi:hypothetical protein